MEDKNAPAATGEQPAAPKKKVSVQFGATPAGGGTPMKRGMSRKKTPMPTNAMQEVEEHREQLEKWGETPPPEGQDMAYLKEAEAVLQQDGNATEDKK